MNTFEELVRRELEHARAKHKGANSPHEGYAIILEELEEYWAEVKAQEHRKDRMVAELVQVAAMCQRVAEDVLMDKPKRVPCAACDRGDFSLGHADGCTQNVVREPSRTHDTQQPET